MSLEIMVNPIFKIEMIHVCILHYALLLTFEL